MKLFNKDSGNTFVELLLVVGIIAMITIIAIPNLLRARVTSNDTAAQEALKVIASGLDSYAISTGTYPPDTTALYTATPSYLNRDFFASTYSGFDFQVDGLTDYTYKVSATPTGPNMGSRSFTVNTGGLLDP